MYYDAWLVNCDVLKYFGKEIWQNLLKVQAYLNPEFPLLGVYTSP
jgi:hypothetical protein